MEQHDPDPRLVLVPARIDPAGELRGYLRMAAVGDALSGGSSTALSPLLARSVGLQHDVSFHCAARPGATAADVVREQLGDALAHRPHIVVLAVGTCDVRSPSWDGNAFSHHLLTVGDALAGAGSLLVLIRLTTQAGDPARAVTANGALDALHRRHGGVAVDLEQHPGASDPEFWSEPGTRLSRLGQVALLHEAAALLDHHGLLVDTDLRNGLRSPHHVRRMTTVTDYEQGRSATPLPFWPLGKVTPS